MTRRVLVAATALAVLGACGGARPVQLTTAAPPPSEPPAEVTTTSNTTAPPPTAAPPTTAPSSSTTTTTRARPAPKPVSPPAEATRPAPGETVSATFGPRPKTALVFPYQRGRTTWEGVSEGTTLRVRAEPAPAGGATRFFVESDHARERCSHSVLFGDGFDAKDAKDTATGPATSEFTHIYNRSTRVEFLVQAIVGRCGDNNLYPSLYGWIDIAPSTTPARSQGPEPPTVEALEARAPNEPAGTGLLKAWARGRDADGYIHRFVIDWGDGSPTDTGPNAAYGGTGGCKPTPSGWPGQHEAWLSPPYPEHRYATPGTYTVTVTAVSAGCDGRDEQTAAATFTYRW